MDRWISRWVKPGGSLTPARLRGPDGALLSVEASGAAAVAFLRQTDSKAAERGDRAAIERQEKEVDAHLDRRAMPNARWSRSQHPSPGDAPYTMKEFADAINRIRTLAGLHFVRIRTPSPPGRRVVGIQTRSSAM